MTFYIGLMSGTSLDGVDGVLASFDDAYEARPHVMSHAHRPFDSALKAELLALNTSGSDELHRAALAGNAVARVYASVVESLLESAGIARSAIRAIGAHGQTVRHRPGAYDGVGYTLQLNAPALLAELAGIDVIADFRSRDVAAGGHGAPLVPAFHRAMFGRLDEAVAVLNFGGIANLTVLSADGLTSGFDCGPGNVLLDHWCALHTGRPYDSGGAWGAAGRVIEPLLAAMLAEPFFQAAPPKSTGRDLFNAEWLALHLRNFTGLEPQDVQATLCELTARASAEALERHAPATRHLLVCGGGVLNTELMRRIAEQLPQVVVAATDLHGLPAAHVEACAFAWLARAFVERMPGNLVSVTGAKGPRLLGALYPAGL